MQLWEEGFAKFQGSKYAVCVNSGSSANLALTQALIILGRLSPEHQVVCSSLTWPTAVSPLVQHGCRPWLADVSLVTLNVSPDTLLSIDTSMPPGSIIWLTHALGFCDDLSRIVALCQERGWILLEDCCEAFGSVYGGVRLGRHGLAATFSTYLGHHLSTIEGGMITTDDPALYETLLQVRSHGWARALSQERREELQARHEILPDDEPYCAYVLGYNLRPTEITATIGLSELCGVSERLARRLEVYERIEGRLRSHTGMTVPWHFVKSLVPSPFASPLLAPSANARRILMAACRTAGIECRPLIAGNLAAHPAFTNRVSKPTAGLAGADHLHRCGFYVTCRPDLTPFEEARIGRTIVKTFNAHWRAWTQAATRP